jgi:iron complex outermembrane receptor protein
MAHHKNHKSITSRQGVRFKKSLLAMCVMAMGAPSFAQDVTSEDSGNIDEIVVSGTRANLQNAQEIKRRSDTFVDAISADDIGSLPDRSVLEAMQRIPGVSIERFAAANDPDHIGVEGSGAVVRGMTQTRSEFNGRDSFTANSGRGLSFQDVPPELMAGVDIYKNQTADMIEGGIAGTISLRTRRPFDQDGRRFSVSADVTYGDMAKETTPTISALFSDRWDTSAGEFGFLINISDSELEAESHGVQNDRMEFRVLEPTALSGDRNAMGPGFPNVANPYVYDGTYFFGGPNSGPQREIEIGTPGVLIPNGANLTMKNDQRERSGIALATQWRSNDESLLATLQFMRSDATLSWTENAIKYQTGFNEERTYGGSYIDGNGERVWEQYEFDNRGIFLGGTLTDVVEGWRGDGDRVPHNASWSSPQVTNFGHRFQTDSRYKRTETVVDDYAFNLEWSPTDKLDLSFDAQYIKADTKDDDVTLMFMTWAIMHMDSSGSTPKLDVVNPWQYAQDSKWYSQTYFQNETSFLYNAAMDHFERSEGDSLALRLDGTYTIDDSFITKIKAGVRSAEREQTVRFSAYNWNRLAPIWDGQGSWLDSDLVQDANLGIYDTVDWGRFYRGGVASIEGDNRVLHPSAELTRDYANWGTRFAAFYNPSDNDTCRDEWRPAGERVEPQWDPETQSCVARKINNGYFLDNEVFKTTESTEAAYVRVDFAADLGEVRMTGNTGVRYVRITNDTEGFTSYPLMQRSERLPSNWNPANVNPADYNLWDHGNNFLGSPVNFISDDIVSFANNAYVANSASRTYDDFLPSLNLKFDLTDDLVARFAVSKAIALPDIGEMRNYINIGSQGFNDSFRQPFWGEDNPHPHTPIDPDTGLRHEQGLPSSVVDANGDPIFDEVADADGGTRFVPVTDPSRGTPIYQMQDDGTYAPVVLDGQERNYTIELENGIYVLKEGNIRSQQRIIDPNGLVHNGWTGSSGNPLLKPMESVQFDASLEWYFSDVGSLTVSYFYKDLKNFFINGAYYREFTNPVTGVSKDVFVSGPQNGGDGEMEGFEIAYQQFFDMLPAPFDGFGVQANYSYIKARGVPNENLDPTNPDLTSDAYNFDDLPLQGQSDHTANFVAMYDKNDWSVRLAYNWRSKYLLTSRDVITGLPVYNDDLGFLDGSIFYNINDNIQVGFQAVNLLDTQTRTLMQIDSKLQVGRSWFVNDRRYTFAIRANF